MMKSVTSHTPPELRQKYINKIIDERERQDSKWGFPQVRSFAEWGSILTEEVGELCKEINDIRDAENTSPNLEVECIQVAAVALSILEHYKVAQDVTSAQYRLAEVLKS